MKSPPELKLPSRARAVSAIIALLILLAPAPAQQGDKPIKLQTDLVAVDVTVTDKDGNFLRKLAAEDFALFEDNEPRQIDVFQASEEAALTRPLAVVFAIDISGSIKPEEIAKQREAMETFTKLARPESVFSVIAFNNEIRVLQDFTSDVIKLSQAFRRIGPAEGSTRIFASIDRAVSMLKRAPRYRSGRRLRRVVIVITDGFDNVDTTDQQDLIRRANDAEVTVYSITLPSYMPGLGDNKRSMTLLDVSRIVPETGGADFSADTKDFSPVFKAIAEEIRSSYTIAFYPPEKNRLDGRVHQIRVECKKSGAIVRASRTSYQAPK
ncbi:MAG: VWA domain-containing protein [Acidobacteriota bacterium]